MNIKMYSVNNALIVAIIGSVFVFSSVAGAAEGGDQDPQENPGLGPLENPGLGPLENPGLGPLENPGLGPPVNASPPENPGSPGKP